MNDTDSIMAIFCDHFGVRPRVVARAPGRLNIVGEHTDYNEGLVLAFAIRQSVLAAGALSADPQGNQPTQDNHITAHSLAMGQSVTFAATVDSPAHQGDWQNYLRGVVFGLAQRGVVIRGANLMIGGLLPIGGGVSSSAALCVATALALLKLAQMELPPLEIAKLVREVEHDFAGTPCGIMDPYVSLFGRANHALLLDCRTITHEYLPIELGSTQFVLIDSGVAHELSSNLYGERVRQCQDAVASLAERDPAIRSLRDVSSEWLERYEEHMDPVLWRRVRHVLAENDRVRQARQALTDGRIEDLGRLLCASHRSLRDDYEVSCSEVDELVAALEGIEGVWGARMVGGGGGGMILALVESEVVPLLPGTLSKCLAGDQGTPDVRIVQAGECANCTAC